jgi:hypothetical protein
MNKLKSTAAVLAGFVLTFLLTRGTDVLLEATGIFPTVEYQLKHGFNVLWMNVLALVYRIFFTMAGGYVTAKLAPASPMKYVIILGIMGTVIAIVANIVISRIPEMANVLPVWFSIALVVTAFPSVWIGGKWGNK